jgi:hypothetical protein
MDLDTIRNLDDEQLKKFINDLSQRNNVFCAKCGNVINHKTKFNINIGIYNRYGQKVKKLCSLCDGCYSDLLDYLSVPDIDWGD